MKSKTFPFFSPFFLRAMVLNVLILAALACSLTGQKAAAPPGTLIGMLSRQLDLVEKGSDQARLQPVGDPVELQAGELVRISNGGEALLEYGDQLQVRLFNDTRTNLVEASSVPGTPLSVQLYLEVGGMTGRLKSPGGSFQVRTPRGAQILVLGTEFFVIYDQVSKNTWVGNFDGLLGVTSGGALVQVPAGTYLMVPDGEPPGPPLPMSFNMDELENIARQLSSSSAALARLALRGLPTDSRVSNLTEVPKETVRVITSATETPLPATQTPVPASETPEKAQETKERVAVPTQTPDTVPPSITLLPPSTEPVGVGLTCPAGAGVVRLKAAVFDPSGVDSVTASWTFGTLRGVEELRRNEKGNYIGEIGPLGSPGTMQVTLNAVDGAGIRGSAPAFQVELFTCPDTSDPVIGALEISPQIVPGLVCAGTPAPLVLSAPVRDDDRVAKVLAIWEVGGVQNSAEMAPAGEGRYQVSLLLNSAAGQVPLYVEAYDEAGHKAVSSSIPVLVEECRDLPPQIESVELSAKQIAAGKDCPTLPGTVQLTARVVDDRQVAQVTARLTLGDSSTDLPLVGIGEDLYRAELGPFEPHGILSIQVNAADSAGQPADPRTEEVEVTSCPDTAGPEITFLSVEPQEVVVKSDCDANQEVIVTAQVVDESSIRQVLAVWQVGGENGEMVMDEIETGLYRTILGPFSEAGELNMTVSAWDEHGNLGDPVAGRVTVKDCVIEEGQ